MNAAEHNQVVSIFPQSITDATVNGAAVDTLDCNDLVGVLTYGAIAENGRVDVKLEEADAPGGSWSDVNSAVWPTGNDIDHQNTTHRGHVRLNVAGRKRYIRAVAEVEETAIVCVVFLLDDSATLPQGALDWTATT